MCDLCCTHAMTRPSDCNLCCTFNMTQVFGYDLLQGSYRDYISLDDEVKQLVCHITMMVLQNADECQVLVATVSCIQAVDLSNSNDIRCLDELCRYNIFTFRSFFGCL